MRWNCDDSGHGVRSSVQLRRAVQFRDRGHPKGDSILARMTIADEVEAKWDRKLSWGVKAAGETEMFTHLSVPVMTRLRLEERLTLDTLVDAGVGRTRSDALAWCVKLVAKNEEKWLGDLRTAFKQVEKVRSAGPSS